jgi:hypothetical protein
VRSRLIEEEAEEDGPGGSILSVIWFDLVYPRAHPVEEEGVLARVEEPFLPPIGPECVRGA